MATPWIEVWLALQTISSACTTAILSLLAGVGIFIPEWVINLVLIGLVLWAFFKWHKKLPWIILAVLFLILFAFFSGFISNLFF